MSNRDQHQHMVMMVMRVALEASLSHNNENHHLAPMSPQLRGQMESAIEAHQGYEDMPLRQISES